jgi:hypothetical protein
MVAMPWPFGCAAEAWPRLRQTMVSHGSSGMESTSIPYPRPRNGCHAEQFISTSMYLCDRVIRVMNQEASDRQEILSELAEERLAGLHGRQEVLEVRHVRRTLHKSSGYGYHTRLSHLRPRFRQNQIISNSDSSVSNSVSGTTSASLRL